MDAGDSAEPPPSSAAAAPVRGTLEEKIAAPFDKLRAGCAGIGVEIHVPRPKKGSAGAGGRFGKEQFAYDAASDTCRCPEGHTLSRETAMA